jgi:uncharacterized protein (DUF2252 family)
MTSVTERAAAGKAIRLQIPRRSHAGWQPASDRRDPVAMLEEQARSRVPELVPLRYERMTASPFAFFRGGAYIMAADLASMPRTGLGVQLCGDAHLSNFGVYAAPDRRLVFSLNDFDETLPGPFEWDLKRLVASFAIACRDRGFDATEGTEAVLACAREYRESIRQFALMRALDLWYLRLDLDTLDQRYGQGISAKQRRRFEKNVERAQSRTSVRAFRKLVEMVDGRPRFINAPPLIVPVEEFFGADADRLVRLLPVYRRTLSGERRRLLDRFEYAHAARKVVGVGSVGTRAWAVLMLGRDGEDPLFLQLKEAQASVLEPFLGPSRHANHGQRVVEGQRLMQAASDILLGWLRYSDVDGVTRDFYVRQLWDNKGSARVETMEPQAFTAYARACGWTLARAHARSGDAAGIAGYLGSGDTFDRALASFAEAYADQNESDYRALKDAVESGAVPRGELAAATASATVS